MEDIKTKQVTIRVTEAELQQVREFCKANEVTAADMVRGLFGLQKIGGSPQPKLRVGQ